MISFFENKILQSKKKFENYETITSVIESVDTIVIIGATTISVTLSVTGVGLVVVPISAGVACAVSLSIDVIQKIFSMKIFKYKT